MAALLVLGLLLSQEPITPDDPSSLQRAFNAAIRAGTTKLVIPAGTYRLPVPQGVFSLLVRDAKDLEIDARGAEIVIGDPLKGGLQFFRCRNVKLRGLSIRHDLPPFTQGRIVAIAPDEKSLDVKIHEGYPAPEETWPAAYVFDPKTRLWKAGTIDLSPQRVEPLEKGLFRLHFRGKCGRSVHPVEVGDLLAYRGRGLTDLHLGACSGITVEDVTIRNGGGFCVHEDGGEGGNRYRYRVTYGPKPPGATEAPLLSCNADAFHSSGVRKGPTLEGCLFEGMGDDGIPIHGAYSLIVESREKSWVATDGVLREGDPLRLFNPDGGPAGEGKVVSIRRLQDYSPTEKSRFHGFADFSKQRLLERCRKPLGENGLGQVTRACGMEALRRIGLLLQPEGGLNQVDGRRSADGSRRR